MCDEHRELIEALREQNERLAQEISRVGDTLVQAYQSKLTTTTVHVHGIEDPRQFSQRVQAEIARR